ncbi:MAG: hypothetical protein JXK07_02100 [Spirochaetes bacterium]|nr:hypothetical protein [Spirochaetota bacterium]MBN2771845.1 hypothetical protein [Spirochaetota bacterium]
MITGKYNYLLNFRNLLGVLLFCCGLFFWSISCAENGDNSNSNSFEADKFKFIENFGDLPIREFRIRGLSRTSSSVVKKQINVSLGENISRFDPDLFTNNSEIRRLFSDIQISYSAENDMAVIEIMLHEKWTLIPFPLFIRNSNKVMVGLYVMESNFLGLGKTLYGGANYSNHGWSTLGGYLDSAFMSSDFKINLFGKYSMEEYEDADESGKTEREYKAQSRIFRAGIGHPVIKNMDIYLFGAYSSQVPDESYSKNINLPDAQKEWIASTRFDFKNLKYKEYLSYGITLRLDIARHLAVSDNYHNYNSLEFKSGYSCILYKNKLELLFNGYYGDPPDILSKRVGGRSGYYTLPADITVSKRNLSGTVSVERPLVEISWGAVTAKLFWEQGVYGAESNLSRFYGPGGGFFFYLKRIAIPALGFNYARNLGTENSEFSVSAGANF